MADDGPVITFTRTGGDGFAVILELSIPGEPKSKERPRHGANSNTFTPKATRDAEAVIGMLARAQMRGTAPAEGPVGVAAEFYCGTRHRKDADNMLKTLTDAMNNIVYKDDWQIEEVFVRVHRGVGGGAARTQVCVWLL